MDCMDARYKAFQLSENLRCRGHSHPAKLLSLSTADILDALLGHT